MFDVKKINALEGGNIERETKPATLCTFEQRTVSNWEVVGCGSSGTFKQLGLQLLIWKHSYLHRG